MLACPITYNARMRAGLAEKLFFADRLCDVDVFVDIGCADGALAAALCDMQQDRPRRYIGYDIVPAQADIARALYGGGQLSFFHDFDRVLAARRQAGGTGCIILSSVVHEILSQGVLWPEFMAQLHALDCRYIAVRDMAVAAETVSSASNGDDVMRVRRRPDIAKRLKSFENRWGDIGRRANLVHFLLKYRWEKNWAHEIAENYLAVSAERYLTLFSGYRPVFFDHHVLPHLRQAVMDDFGIALHDATHIKMIVERTGG